MNFSTELNKNFKLLALRKLLLLNSLTKQCSENRSLLWIRSRIIQLFNRNNLDNMKFSLLTTTWSIVIGIFLRHFYCFLNFYNSAFEHMPIRFLYLSGIVKKFVEEPINWNKVWRSFSAYLELLKISVASFFHGS